MLKITHPKVASLAPSWAPYAGCTILFDGLGTVSSYSCKTHAPAQCLHHELATAVNAGAEAWQRIGFCPLPPSSFHLTAADLLHPGNISQLNAPGRELFLGADLRLLRPSALAQKIGPLVNRSGLLGLKQSEMAFCFERMHIRGKSVLVAELSPDPLAPSQQAFKEFLSFRDTLSSLLKEELGLSLPAYRPHVTIGYFANSEFAVEGALLIDELDENLRHFRTRSFNYGKPKIFTFSDMASFEVA